MGLCCSKESRNNPLNAVLLDESYISSAQSPILRSSTTHEAQDENPILDVSTNSNADENTEGKGAPNVSTQQFAESRSSELQGLLTALEKHNPGAELFGGETLRTTIEASESVLYDKYPLHNSVESVCTGGRLICIV
eukprot:gene34437-44490_t